MLNSLIRESARLWRFAQIVPRRGGKVTGWAGYSTAATISILSILPPVRRAEAVPPIRKRRVVDVDTAKQHVCLAAPREVVRQMIGEAETGSQYDENK